MMQGFYDRIALVYFTLATLFLMLVAMLLLGSAVWEMMKAVAGGEVVRVLESVGLVIIGFAIIETAKFVAEEEILRRKELRSAVESRRSLTKFITIIVIAASLEALVMIFETSHTDVTKAIYPAALFGGRDVRADRARRLSVAVEPDRAAAGRRRGRLDRPQRGGEAGGIGAHRRA